MVHFFVLAAFLLIPLILFSNQIMEALFLIIEDPRYGSLIVSTLLFFLPTAVLGMIAPYSVRLLVIDSNHSGHVAGTLYFVSTMGERIRDTGNIVLFSTLV